MLHKGVYRFCMFGYMKTITILLIAFFLVSCGNQPQRKHKYLIRLVENNAKMGWESMWDDDDILFKVGDTVVNYGCGPNGEVLNQTSVITKVYK